MSYDLMTEARRQSALAVQGAANLGRAFSWIDPFR